MKSLLTFFGAIVTLLSPGIQTTGTPPVDTFVSLAESTTFGPSGTIMDLTGRFALPEYIPPRTDFSTITTEDISLRDVSCSTDDTTWELLREKFDNDGSGDVADNTRVWLPQSCKIKAFTTAATSDGVEMTINQALDNVVLYCNDPDTCGFDVVYRAGSSPQWDYTAGDAYGGQLRRWIIAVGATASSGISESTCNWTAGYNLGTKMIQVGSADGTPSNGDDNCSMTISGTGSNEWGPGDIVRLTIDDIDGFGTKDPTPLYRVTCVRDADGDYDPNTPTAAECNEITGNNQLQISDPLPMDYNPTGVFAGANAGTGFSGYPAGTPGTYTTTSGHRVIQIERVGNGTRTNNIAEDIYFHNIGWSIYPEYLGSEYLRFLDVYNAQVYGNKIDGRVGRQATMTTGGSGPGEASHISFHSNDWTYGSFKTTCFAEITKIEIVDSNTLGITYDNSGTCNFANAGGDDSAGFTSDVDEPLLAGLTMVKTASTLVSTSPARRRFTVDVTSTTGANECEEGTADPCEGIAIDLDKFDNGVTNCNDRSSNIQYVNNTFINTRQGNVIQGGCSQFIFAANYTHHEPTFGTGRGPFHHGNAEGFGNHFEMNDQDQPFSTLKSSNRAPTDHGECISCTWYKNRCTESAQSTPPSLSSYATRGVCFDIDDEDQFGAANEDWTIVLNVGDDIVSTGDLIDDANNNPEDFPSDNDAPHFTYNLRWARNRCYQTGCDHDNNFDANNTSTVRDNAATDQDEGAATVPAGWSSEIGEEPTSLFFTAKPEFWCNEAVTFGEIGAYYDDFSGTPGKLPAQIRYEGTTCTPP